MITFLQAVNRVLVKLRENELTTFSGMSNYEKLIAALVNEAKEEVEASWDWNYQRATYTITTANGTSTYALTGAGSELTIEGVVVRSYPLMLFRDGSPIMWKLKVKDYKNK